MNMMNLLSRPLPVSAQMAPVGSLFSVAAAYTDLCWVLSHCVLWFEVIARRIPSARLYLVQCVYHGGRMRTRGYSYRNSAAHADSRRWLIEGH